MLIAIHAGIEDMSSKNELLITIPVSDFVICFEYLDLLDTVQQNQADILCQILAPTL